MFKRIFQNRTTIVTLIIFGILFVLNIFYANFTITRKRSIEQNEMNSNFIVIQDILESIKTSRLNEIFFCSTKKDIINYIKGDLYFEKEVEKFLSNLIGYSKLFKRVEIYDKFGNRKLGIYKAENKTVVTKNKKNISELDYYIESRNIDDNELYVTRYSYENNDEVDTGIYKKYPTTFYVKNVYGINNEILGVIKFDYYPMQYFEMMTNLSTVLKNNFYLTTKEGYGFTNSSSVNQPLRSIDFTQKYGVGFDLITESDKKSDLIFGKKGNFYFYKLDNDKEYALKELQYELTYMIFQIPKGTSLYISKNIALCVLHYVLIEKLALNLLVIVIGLVLGRGFNIFIELVLSKKNLELKRINEERYKIIVNHVGDIVFDWDIKNDKIYISDNFKSKMGYDYGENDFISRILCGNKLFPDDKLAIKKMLDRIYDEDQIEFDVKVKNIENKTNWFHVSFTVIRDNGSVPVRAVGVMVDITEAKESERILLNKASLDGLTKIYNRVTFEEFAEMKLQLAKKNKQKLFLAFFDIDDFKYFNDTYGHNVGDRVIVLVAETIQNASKKYGICGRLGGDEFVMLVKADSKETFSKIVSSITEKLKKGIKIRESKENLSIYCSIGASVYPDSGIEYTTLLKKADEAMYNIKISNKKLRKDGLLSEDYKLL